LRFPPDIATNALHRLKRRWFSWNIREKPTNHRVERQFQLSSTQRRHEGSPYHSYPQPAPLLERRPGGTAAILVRPSERERPVRYERQWWQKERLKGADEEHRKVVLGFYKAEVLPNAGAYLHGRKGRAYVYVDGIDSILTRDEVRAVAKAAREAGAQEVHCLAWEFEMDLRLVCHELEATEGVLIKLIPIPREIMEKNRTSPPPFLEVAVLEAEVDAISRHSQRPDCGIRRSTRVGSPPQSCPDRGAS
jgi:hypothetical protein